ncbi:polysaccharide pyruvyl transferase family protein, partial [Clostridium perfringens]
NESFDLMIPVNVYDRNDLVDYADAYIDGLLAYIGYSKNKGRQVKILIFCEKENDNEICKKVFDRAIDEYGKESVELVRYVSTSQIVNLFINAHTIFATRFHAMILGLLFDKKVFPIIYSSK